MKEIFFIEQPLLMPTDKALVSVYVPQEMKEKLEAWAKQEERSVSYIVGKLIAEAIELRTSSQKEPPESTRRKKGE